MRREHAIDGRSICFRDQRAQFVRVSSCIAQIERGLWHPRTLPVRPNTEAGASDVRNNHGMNKWGVDAFGEPCRVCGFTWSMAFDDAAATVDGAPARLRAVVRDDDQRRRHPELQWSVSGYLCHVGDSIRVWSERIAHVVLGESGPVAVYSQDKLAEARHYDDIGVRTALWSLERAVLDWRTAVALADPEAFAMRHEEMGTMSLHDVVNIRAHDVTHHIYDVERILASGRE
jgi:hypothetical protein